MQPWRRLRMPGTWPPAARRWALGMIVAGGTADILLLATNAWRLADMALFSVLMFGGTAVTLVQRWFGAPTRLPGQAEVDLQSIWVFAVALLLPPAYAALAPAVLEWSAPPSSRVSGSVNRLLNVSSLGLSGAAAGLAASLFGGTGGPALARLHAVGSISEWRLLAGVAAGAAAFTALNAVTIAEMVHRHHGSTRLDAVGRWPGVAVELAVQCTGALLAVSWAIARPLGALSLPPLVLLQRSLLHTQLLEAARTDPKTGLVNLTHWRQLAEVSCRRAVTTDASLAVALVDLDHFKRVNDVYGHLVGDEVLLGAADALRSCSRADDVVGRFGGEEFAVLLPGVAGPDAFAAAERLRRAIAAVRPVELHDAMSITASVGVAVLGEHGSDLDALLRAADRALYGAKADGRNRVQAAVPLSTEGVVVTGG